MNIELPREIASDEVNTYHRDGVVLLKSMLDSDWVEVLKQAIVREQICTQNSGS